MEKKSKHRLAGLLVVLGLLVILVPLVQTKGDLSLEPTEIKAPPFPDQPVQVISSGTEQMQDTEEKIVAKTIPTVVNSDANKIEAVPIKVINEPQPIQTVIVNNNQDNKVVHKPEKKLAHLTKKPTRVAHNKPAKLHTPVNDDSLMKLKQAAWVIQIGSFKNKTNALRIVNRLRANGYHAFIQQVSTPFGQSTRVFVGPEIKRTSVHQLAGRLEAELHMRGVIISYKPLAL